MVNIFAMNEKYQDHYDQEYTRNHLIEILELSRNDESTSEFEYKSAKKRCAELCPMTFAGKLLPKAPKERFKYLQFLHYMIEKNRRCKEKGFSVFDCIETPSEWHLDLYNEMIKEIWKKVSINAHTLAGNKVRKKVSINARILASEVDYDITESPRKYDDSIHACQQFADRIAGTLYNFYHIGNGMMACPTNIDRVFYEWMDRLLEQTYSKATLESCWDELFLRLYYARCMYWELDMLSAYQEVQEASSKPLSENDKYFAMREENGRLDVLLGDRMLIFDSETKKIIETYSPDFGSEDTFTVSDVELYINELIQYIEDHVSEISKKTFQYPKEAKSSETKILNHIYDICEYLRMDFQRYGRLSPLSKTKLISAYQAFFLASPSLGIAPTMKGTVKARTSKGLKRAKNTVTSLYSEPDTKDPLGLQLVCAWTGYQFVWNMFGSHAAKKYLEINIKVLQTMLGIGYQAGMVGLQCHAEKVILATLATLIPYEDGVEEFKNCMKALGIRGFDQTDDSIIENLCIFGKFCRLFNTNKVATLIAKSLNAKKKDPIYEIALNEATDDTIRICSPKLQIRYDIVEDTYTIQNFYVEYPVTKSAPKP